MNGFILDLSGLGTSFIDSFLKRKFDINFIVRFDNEFGEILIKSQTLEELVFEQIDSSLFESERFKNFEESCENCRVISKGEDLESVINKIIFEITHKTN